MANFPQNFTLDQKLDLELVRRTAANTFAFLALGILVLVFELYFAEPSRLIVAAACVSLLSSLLRIINTRKLISKNIPDSSAMRLLKLTILIHGITWSVIASALVYQSELKNSSGFFGFAIISCFSMAACISIAPSRNLGALVEFIFCFPLVLIGPLIAEKSGDPLGYWMAALMFVGTVYTIKQMLRSHNELLQLIQYEESLALSNEELIQSRRQLAEEIAKNLHSMRMASLGEMAEGIAHEINNPLMIIQGHAEKIRKILKTISSSEFAGVSIRNDKVLLSVSRIARIIDSLLLFSRKTEDVNYEVVAIDQVLSATLDLCHEKLRHRKISLRVNSEVNSKLRCRAVQISQVLVNLINNSIEAVANRPEAWIEIRTTESNGYLKIEITDSGVGISTETQEKMFQPFFSTKAIGAGPGLGLSVALGIIQQHKGELDYKESANNTTFVISLPIAENKAVSNSA